MIQYTNISGTAETEIIPKTTGDGRLDSISIANTHTHAFSISVALDTGSTKYHIVKGVVIPQGATLVLDDDNVFFNSRDVSLKIQLGAASSGTSTATIITKTKMK
jgi:hypothetical protein